MTTPGKNFHSRAGMFSVGLLVALTLTACSSSSSSTSTGTSAAATPSATASSEMAASATAGNATTAKVATAKTDLGTVLVDGKGMTLYLYTNDTQNSGKSTCEGPCLAAWPALLGTPTAGAGVDKSLLGTLTRSDGSTQASYNGWPLYYWAKDKAPGDTTGQGVGKVWYVLDAKGDAVGAPSASSAG
jgi:predicted lipoprotein with Yx(FWY)xxD motif